MYPNLDQSRLHDIPEIMCLFPNWIMNPFRVSGGSYRSPKQLAIVSGPWRGRGPSFLGGRFPGLVRPRKISPNPKMFWHSELSKVALARLVVKQCLSRAKQSAATWGKAKQQQTKQRKAKQSKEKQSKSKQRTAKQSKPEQNNAMQSKTTQSKAMRSESNQH